MSIYAPLDIHFDEHPSHADLELEHLGLQACAIAYCNRLLTDGFVSDRALRNFGKSGKGPRLAPYMIKQGKWVRVDGGFAIVGFLDWNPSRVEVLARREARSKAGQKGGVSSGLARSKGEANASTESEANAKQVLPQSLNEIEPSPSPSPSPKRGEAPVSEIQPRLDPELGGTFVSALLSLGHTVARNKFAWQDLGDACATYWPKATARDRHELLRASVTQWARGTDAKKSRGWDHNEWIRWANQGNVSAGTENRDAERAAKLEAQRAKTKAYLAAVKRVEAPQATHAAPESQRFHVDPAMDQDEAING